MDTGLLETAMTPTQISTPMQKRSVTLSTITATAYRRRGWKSMVPRWRCRWIWKRRRAHIPLRSPSRMSTMILTVMTPTTWYFQVLKKCAMNLTTTAMVRSTRPDLSPIRYRWDGLRQHQWSRWSSSPKEGYTEDFTDCDDTYELSSPWCWRTMWWP